jgi:hypothetical protein
MSAGGEVREDHRLAFGGQDVRGLRHEVDAAEHDRLGLRARPRRVRELERVAEEVGVLHDLVPLIEVAEDDDAVSERLARGDDPAVQLLR